MESEFIIYVSKYYGLVVFLTIYQFISLPFSEDALASCIEVSPSLLFLPIENSSFFAWSLDLERSLLCLLSSDEVSVPGICSNISLGTSPNNDSPLGRSFNEIELMEFLGPFLNNFVYRAQVQSYDKFLP